MNKSIDTSNVRRAGGWKRRCRSHIMDIAKTPNQEILTASGSSSSETSPSGSPEGKYLEKKSLDKNKSSKNLPSVYISTNSDEDVFEEIVEVAEDALLSPDIMVDSTSSSSSGEEEANVHALPTLAHHTLGMFVQSNRDRHNSVFSSGDDESNVREHHTFEVFLQSKGDQQITKLNSKASETVKVISNTKHCGDQSTSKGVVPVNPPKNVSGENVLIKQQVTEKKSQSYENKNKEKKISKKGKFRSIKASDYIPFA